MHDVMQYSLARHFWHRNPVNFRRMQRSGEQDPQEMIANIIQRLAVSKAEASWIVATRIAETFGDTGDERILKSMQEILKESGEPQLAEMANSLPDVLAIYIDTNNPKKSMDSWMLNMLDRLDMLIRNKKMRWLGDLAIGDIVRPADLTTEEKKGVIRDIGEKDITVEWKDSPGSVSMLNSADVYRLSRIRDRRPIEYTKPRKGDCITIIGIREDGSFPEGEHGRYLYVNSELETNHQSLTDVTAVIELDSRAGTLFCFALKNIVFI